MSLPKPWIPTSAAPDRGTNQPNLNRFISHDLRKAVLARDQNRCVRCGDTQYLEIDHAIPHGMGGLAELDNLQTLCHGCNQKKACRIWFGKSLEAVGIIRYGSDYLALLYRRTGMTEF